jgi:3-oxoacyl-[acyl-carrier protein] reductase
MNIRFDGKLVVVSGAGHGLGRAIAQSFADLGATVHGCDLSADNLAETAKGRGIRTRVVDLTDRKAAAGWIGDVEQETGQAIYCLVNNAGGVAGQVMVPLDQVSDEAWDRIFAVNVNAAIAGSQRSSR